MDVAGRQGLIIGATCSVTLNPNPNMNMNMNMNTQERFRVQAQPQLHWGSLGGKGDDETNLRVQSQSPSDRGPQ
jgi:hypothetical protein